ncbi:hypothetical protein [Halobacillus salinus]|uniref:Uncharacterized protein n=1 Tax=Halobacillus salinus TaxID=192814 RepID=A0A4Z0H2A8_9BACI|nr:hypothetical protein [Halobacillus salinus]TGB04538.1 hypothetical protein E4663_05970 [Halobacillus salinus]
MGAYWFLDQDANRRPEFTVHGSKFSRDRVGGVRYVEMITEGFTITPGFIMLDTKEPLEQASSPNETAENYIKRGCTLLVVKHLVTSIRHYREKYDHFLKTLESLPVPFMVTPVIPAHLLNPEMVRYFSRKGSPFLCVEVQCPEDLDSLKWEWIVQAQSHRRIPLTIFVKDGENTSVNYTDLWSQRCEQYGMIRLTDVQEDEWLTFQNLKDSGIYPNRGAFVYGGQADYNLFRKGGGSTFDEQDKFRYHNAVPDVTVIGGRIVQVQQQVIDHRSKQHVRVNVHKHFV